MYCTKEYKDKLFQMTKPIDEKIKREIDEDFFLQDGYLFKENNKYHRTAYCTCCQQRFDLDGMNIDGIQVSNDLPYKYMRHNETTKCPLCGKPVVVKDSGRGRSKLIDRGYVAIFQKLKNQMIVLRSFAVMRNYSGSYDEIETKYSEHYRIYFKPGEVHSFKRRNTSYYYLQEAEYFSKYSDCYITFEEMAKQPKSIKYPQGFNGWAWLYDRDVSICPVFYNCDVVLKSKYFKYSAFDEFCRCQNDDVLHKYLDFYCKHPVLAERLVKEGFSNILSQILRGGIDGLNYRAKTVKRFFKMNKSELNLLKDLNTARAVRVKYYGLTLTKKTFDYVMREYYHPHQIKGYLENNHIPCEYGELINYLVKQSSDFSIYRDYVNWLIKYNFELTRKKLFPRYLKQAHDEMMKYDVRCEALKKEKEDKEKFERFNSNILPFLQKIFSFSDDEYIVRPFENILEIINEGQIQNICVGGSFYTEKYLAGKTYLFCLREAKQPDTPYCTIEVGTNGRLIQSRIKNNGSPSEGAKAFIDKWQHIYSKNLKKYNKQKEVA